MDAGSSQNYLRAGLHRSCALLKFERAAISRQAANSIVDLSKFDNHPIINS